MNSMDEQRLIAGCKRGELWARREVYEKYAPAMLSLCVRYVADYEDAKDLLQDGFVKIFTRINQFAGKGNFGGWIRQVFVNVSLEHLRRKDFLKTENSIEELRTEEEPGVLPEHLSADDLMECIAELPNGLRTIFNLYAIEGYSHHEIGEILGIQENSSRSQFARARLILQQNVFDLMKKDHAKR